MSAYYNENDPFAAAWLRELIKVNLIAQGEVDERSIEDVEADDLRGFTQCHFFAGIGGWSYALRLAGWPDTRPVWTGSCPCQPFSFAGKKACFHDSRHLWPTWFRLIQQRKPPTVLGEQVASTAGYAWIDHVSTDLETENYAFGAATLTAASVGAPHARHRLYFVASMPNANGGRWERIRTQAIRTWDEQQFERLVQNQLQLSVPSGRLRSLVDGFSKRMGRLRGYGNAIVPQVAQAFIEAYIDCEHS